MENKPSEGRPPDRDLQAAGVGAEGFEPSLGTV